MNYKKIYMDLMDDCARTSVTSRLIRRNKNDIRLNGNYVYTEKHHIIPKHDLGNNDIDNFVSLLPEEHLLAHLIRYKAYNQRSDFLAARFMINGYLNKKYLIDDEYFNNISFIKRIGLFKHLVQKFRKTHGWQTKEGRKSISNARKNKFPCVDAETRESVGSQDKHHPRVLSGEWIHHSKGKLSVTHKLTKKRMYILTTNFDKLIHIKNSGQNGNGVDNPNYKEMTDSMKIRIYEIVKWSIIEKNHFSTSVFGAIFKEEFKNDFKKISYVWIMNNFKSWEGLMKCSRIPNIRKIKNKKTKKIIVTQILEFYKTRGL